MVPGEDSTGGKQKLLGTSKRVTNTYEDCSFREHEAHCNTETSRLQGSAVGWHRAVLCKNENDRAPFLRSSPKTPV
jgi:hypothetical protein